MPSQGNHQANLSLSPQQKRVVEMLAAGMSRPQIALELKIKRRMIDTYIDYAYARMPIKLIEELGDISPQEALAEWGRRGDLEPS